MFTAQYLICLLPLVPPPSFWANSPLCEDLIKEQVFICAFCCSLPLHPKNSDPSFTASGQIIATQPLRAGHSQDFESWVRGNAGDWSHHQASGGAKTRLFPSHEFPMGSVPSLQSYLDSVTFYAWITSLNSMSS